MLWGGGGGGSDLSHPAIHATSNFIYNILMFNYWGIITGEY